MSTPERKKLLADRKAKLAEPMPENPTWEDVVRQRRLNQKLSAEVTVLKEELDVLDEIKANLSDEEKQRRDLVEQLEEKQAAVKRTALELFEARTQLCRLETENGMLEARLARALGRTIVVEATDEIAFLVSTLHQINEWCEASIGKLDGPRLRDGFRNYPPQEVEARLRQVRNAAHLALKKCGARDVVKNPEQPGKESPWVGDEGSA